MRSSQNTQNSSSLLFQLLSALILGMLQKNPTSCQLQQVLWHNVGRGGEAGSKFTKYAQLCGYIIYMPDYVRKSAKKANTTSCSAKLAKTLRCENRFSFCVFSLKRQVLGRRKLNCSLKLFGNSLWPGLLHTHTQSLYTWHWQPTWCLLI